MKIVVAVDGSECSTFAVEELSKRLWLKDDQFQILAVVEPIPTEFGIGYIPPVAASGELTDRLLNDTAEFAAKAATIIQKALPENEVDVKVATGQAAETICKQAEDFDADKIVMGSHGRKGISHFLLGSVAEEVLKRSPCSVEIVKTKKQTRKEATKKESAKQAKGAVTSKA